MGKEHGDFLADFVAGGISATVSKTVMAPIERVKLLLQTQQVNTMLENRYLGLVDCTKRVYQEQGLLSFWRGNMANIVRFFPNHALNFSLKDFFKNSFVGSATKEKDFWKFFVGNLAAGGAAGGAALIFVHPLDILRTQLAADVGTLNMKKKSYASCAKVIFKKSGFVGFYKGFAVSMVGVVTFKALFLGGYDITKSIMNLEDDHKTRSTQDSITKYYSLVMRFILAQSVTTIVGGICYPLDTIRRRIMMQTQLENGKFLYKNAFHCTKMIFEKEGLKGFYSGFSANLVRGLGGAILLVGYDEAKVFFRFYSDLFSKE